MGIDSTQFEIISTPEANGMRLPPSARGSSININRLQTGRGPTVEIPRRDRIGRFERGLDHARKKSDARLSPEAAKPLQLLQVDSPIDHDFSRMKPVLLPTNFAGLDDSHAAPSSCSIAAGPDHLLVSVNSYLAVIEKSGRQLMRRELGELFYPLARDVVIYSPKLIYDSFLNRWAIAACACSVDKQRSWLLLAYSQSNNPLGGWWIWMLDAATAGGMRSGAGVDGLGLSVDQNHLYLSVDLFGGQEQYLSSKLRVMGKKELQTGGVLHGWEFWDLRNADGTLASSLQPAQNLSPSPMQYMVNATDDGQGLTLWSLATEMRGQNPILSRRFLPTTPYLLSPNAKQRSSKTAIETGDTRLGNVVYRNGVLWAAHTIAANWGDDENVSAIQWFQINPHAGIVTHQGIYGAPHFNYFSPAVMADHESNLILVFNRCGEKESASIRFTGRRLLDQANTLQPSSLLQQGTRTESPDWMAFAGACASPEDSSIWVTGQYAAARNDWATWIGALVFDEIKPSRQHRFDDDLDAAVA